MENELDLRERICRAFTTDITVAGGAREAVIANFFLALILIFSTASNIISDYSFYFFAWLYSLSYKERYKIF